MLYQIVAFLLDVATGLMGAACLLRLYMQLQRVPFGNPVGRFIFALTDWLVLPLRRVLPAIGRWDSASIAAVFLLELLRFGLLWLLAGGSANPSLLPVLALFGMLRLVISSVTGLMIVYVILSWVQSGSPLASIIERLCVPMLHPIRRLIPLVGGIDLSPLVLLVLLQIAAIVLDQVQRSVL